MTLADCSDKENRKAFEARKTLKIMTPSADSSIRVPPGGRPCAKPARYRGRINALTTENFSISASA
jgi:hypothetical protein